MLKSGALNFFYYYRYMTTVIPNLVFKDLAEPFKVKFFPQYSKTLKLLFLIIPRGNCKHVELL